MNLQNVSELDKPFQLLKVVFITMPYQNPFKWKNIFTIYLF